MREVTKIYADDGTECETREDALARDRAMEWRDVATVWLERCEYGERKIAEYARLIRDWELFKATRGNGTDDISDGPGDE